MNKSNDALIDCLLVGHNEMDFSQYRKEISKMGVNSGAYRDLMLNFLQYDNKPYTASEIYNLFYCNDNNLPEERKKPLRVTEVFSAAIAYLGTYLHRRGFNFDYVNAFQLEKEELKKKLQQQNILTIGIITTLYVSPLPIIEIIRFIKQYNTTAKIIIGGPFVSTRFRVLDPEALKFLLESTLGIDIYINSSQGEETLVHVLQALKENRPLESLNNIYFKAGASYKGTSVLKEANKLSENMVDWSLFSDRVGEYINARTAISCPFSCSFCGFPQHAGKYQTAPVPEIEKELNAIEAIGTVKNIHFIDDTFNVPRERFKEILRMMIKNKYGFKWYSHYRCQFADRETVELMKESGCSGVFLGIESGSDTILKNMRKATTVEKYYKGVSLLKEIGILTYGSFIIGFPGETEETVQETVRFIRKSGLDFYRAQLWYCETLTPIWQEREKYKIKGESFEWSHATMNARRAGELIDWIFCSIDEPIWVPQYNFEFAGLFHLFNRGMSLEQVKGFLKAFNRGIEEKLNNPAQQEVSFDVIRQIKESCTTSVSQAETVHSTAFDEKYEADFFF
jgi:radical SAM PhpK family P-methyltransferase